ncbi:MAG: hypothetical protein FJW22_04610 [Acidimicrobiia bacterium]|nr:hypothetical protein [Acidimicrobiia bacterium]
MKPLMMFAMRLQAGQNLPPTRMVDPATPIMTPTDRIVFYAREVMSDAAEFQAVDATIAGLIKEVAQRLPLP